MSRAGVLGSVTNGERWDRAAEIWEGRKYISKVQPLIINTDYVLRGRTSDPN